MTQEERWLAKWNIAMGFIQTNERNLSKFVGEEREIRNWIRHNKKLLNAGLLKCDREEKFKELLGLSDEHKHINQYK